MKDWKQTAQRLKLQERLLTINTTNIIRWTIYTKQQFLFTKTSIDVFLKVAFLLAKLFSDLDNPDCLDFCAMPAVLIFLSISTHRLLFPSAELSVFSWRNGKKSSSFVVHTGTGWIKITWNLIQESSEDNYGFSNAEKRTLNTNTHWTQKFYGEKVQAFSFPYGFRVTTLTELEFNVIQSLSGIEQRRSINNFCLN